MTSMAYTGKYTVTVFTVLSCSKQLSDSSSCSTVWHNYVSETRYGV